MSLLIYKVSKWIDHNRLLDRISFFLPRGCLASLLGPSGSGKSTLLRVIAGLETKEVTGSIWLNGRESTTTPVQFRRMGFVFQNFALFPNMTVKQNIGFGLKLRYVPQEEIEDRIESLMEALRITDIEDQYPIQLSGGQKQRVALARSLIVEPEFLLLDEPFKALDNELRNTLSSWLQMYLKDKHITALMVTHDPTEAMLFADEILVLRNGRLIQQGSSDFIYDNPINDFVGYFLGPFVPNKMRLWSIVTFRSHDLTLSLDHTPNSYKVLLQGLVYKRQIVQLSVQLISIQQTLIMEVGYKTFSLLNLHKRTNCLYLQVANW